MKLELKIYIILISAMLSSCAINKPIYYYADDIWPEKKNTPIPISVSIQMFEDNRMNIEENSLLFNSLRQVKLDSNQVCINAERHYRKDTVVAQIPKMLTKHLNNLEVFSRVLYNKKEVCDYYITATLNSYFAKQEYSTAAAIGASFGLMGAIATAGIKTSGNIIIDISDVKMFDKQGNLVLDIGSFYKEYEEEMSVTGDCFSIYDNINRRLKEFNSFLIEQLKAEANTLNF